MALAILFLIIGLCALVFGGELLVRGAVGLAERAGISALVIGLFIVGFGTSMPELVTSVEAALAGSPDIAWGNIVGSNIANSLLILGAAAVIAPIAITSANRLRDPAVAIGSSLVLAGLAVTGFGHWLIGLLLVAILLAYIFHCYRQERAVEPESVHNAPYDRSLAMEMSDSGLHSKPIGWGRPIMLTLVGLVVLIGGGRLLVSGAIDLATLAGLSETLIGLTIVAVGTSLPELVTSVIAARKGEAEVAFGNVVGSNIYNILGIGGATMLMAPGQIPTDLIPLDIGLMTASAIAILLLIGWRGGVGRIYGLTLIVSYCVYLAILVAKA